MNLRYTGFLLVIFAFLRATILSAEPGEILIERVLAVVNGRPIFYGDIKNKIEAGPLVVVSEYPDSKDAPPLTRALNDAINFELIMGAAKDLDIEVSEADLDQEINSFLEEQKISKEKLEEVLKGEGKTLANYRRDFRDQMVFRRFQRRVIAPLIKVTDKDIENYYLSQTGASGNDQIEVSLRQLLIKFDSNMNKELIEAKKTLANEVYGKLKGGLDFTDAIGLYSDDEAAKSPKQKPIQFKLRDLAAIVKSAIEPLKPGEFTAPVTTANGLILFQLVDKKLAENRDLAGKKSKIEQELRMMELITQTNKWLAEQHLRVTIKKIEE